VHTQHIPVLAAEVLAGLQPQPGNSFIDATAGGGGHTAMLRQASAPPGRVLGLDADPAALERVGGRLGQEVLDERLVLAQGNFVDLRALAERASFLAVQGILADLGLSSDQLAAGERGFSFSDDGPLDMRFDPAGETSAADLVNTLSETELADAIWRYGEERRSRQIARRIVQARARQPITSTRQLAALVAAGVPGHPGGIHPDTRTFQALRILVNQELLALEAMLPQALDLLAAGGRLALISFHSLEDRIVKRFFQAEARGCICPPQLPVCVCAHQPRLRVVTAHPLVASAEEQRQNTRSRSAKLRIAERLAGQYVRSLGRLRRQVDCAVGQPGSQADYRDFREGRGRWNSIRCHRCTQREPGARCRPRSIGWGRWPWECWACYSSACWPSCISIW
jgi:16S rRNA (cytosine1402-N4)-methyltransferase